MKTEHVIIGAVAVVAIYFLFFRGEKVTEEKRELGKFTKKDLADIEEVKKENPNANVEGVFMKDGTPAVAINGKATALFIDLNKKK